jgi:iron complex outermembrane receptor protein
MPQHYPSRRLLVSLAVLAGTSPTLVAQTAPAPGPEESVLGGKLNGTLSLFHIEKTNIANTDPANPFGFILSGRERSRGVEADLLLNLHDRWQFLAAGSYTDAHVVSDVSAARRNARVNRFSPVQASFWSRYQFGGDSGKGWAVFAGPIYGSERNLLVTHDPNVLRFPSYLRFDAGFSYTFQGAGARWTATVNVQNVNDEVYMEELLRWGNPRNYYARMSVSF